MFLYSFLHITMQQCTVWSAHEHPFLHATQTGSHRANFFFFTYLTMECIWYHGNKSVSQHHFVTHTHMKWIRRWERKIETNFTEAVFVRSYISMEECLEIRWVISICIFSLGTSGLIKLATQSQRVNPGCSDYSASAVGFFFFHSLYI